MLLLLRHARSKPSRQTPELASALRIPRATHAAMITALVFALVLACDPSADSRTSTPMEKARSFIERTFGFHNFRSGQEEILESVLDASDSLVIMPTGGGKSLCFGVWDARKKR